MIINKPITQNAYVLLLKKLLTTVCNNDERRVGKYNIVIVEN